MLQRDKRLNLKKDFKWIVSGKLVDTKFAKLYLKVGENEAPKIGITASSKTFKKATERNRARRLISAALESLYPTLPEKLCLLALPKSPILGVKSGDVLLDLQERLKNAKIIS